MLYQITLSKETIELFFLKWKWKASFQLFAFAPELIQFAPELIQLLNSETLHEIQKEYLKKLLVIEDHIYVQRIN